MTSPSPARIAALDRLTRQAARFSDLEFVDTSDAPEADGARLDQRDTALSRAIEHAVVRRWLTLVGVCRGCIDRRWENVDSRIQAALLAGAAQMLLFGNHADHAVVDDTVEWTKRKGQRGAPGFVNAVLRKIAALRGPVLDANSPQATPDAWNERCDMMPLEDGRVMQLTHNVFNADHMTRLAEQTSHGEDLLLHWMNAAGRLKAFDRAVHGLMNAPVVLTGLASPDAAFAEFLEPHHEPGFWIWKGTHVQLLALLSAHPDARVQDSGSARPVRLTESLKPAVILDACAGRGTKTRQLAQLHPQAEIVATDIDGNRLRSLAKSFEGHPRVKVTTPEGLRRVIGKCDLLLLDVPCSNTGVLARRPEARYRFSRSRQEGLVQLQRTIVNEHLAFLAPGAHLLYSTCSLEAAENEQQADWAARRLRGQVVRSERYEPRGKPGTTPAEYSDGSYGVLIQGP